MSRDTGTATFSPGTGAKTITIGQLAKSMLITFKGPNILPAESHIAGGFQYCFPSDNSLAVTNAIEVQNTSGTVILRGTWTSFTGTTANFNITTQTGTVPQMLLDFEY